MIYYQMVISLVDNYIFLEKLLKSYSKFSND